MCVCAPVPPVHMILLNYKIDGLAYTYVRRKYLRTLLRRTSQSDSHTHKKTTSAAVKVEVTAIIRTELVKRLKFFHKRECALRCNAARKNGKLKTCRVLSFMGKN